MEKEDLILINLLVGKNKIEKILISENFIIINDH